MEPLPELHVAELDAASLAALFTDLDAYADVLDVLVKRGPGRYASETSVSLREARAQLHAGVAHGVQIRYRWEGAEWRDTLLPVPSGVRVVRMRMTDQAQDARER